MDLNYSFTHTHTNTALHQRRNWPLAFSASILPSFLVAPFCLLAQGITSLSLSLSLTPSFNLSFTRLPTQIFAVLSSSCVIFQSYFVAPPALAALAASGGHTLTRVRTIVNFLVVFYGKTARLPGQHAAIAKLATV